jgi:hypothetical protein
VPYNIAEFSTQVSIHFTTCYFLLFLHSYTQANYVVVVKFSSLFGSKKFFFHRQASQGGYGVEFTQAPQSGYSGSYMNQNAHPGYPHIGTTNDIVSQVRALIVVYGRYIK